MNIFDILKTAKNMDASDIHITVGSPIIAKVKGKFINLTEKTLDKFDTEKILEEISDEKSLKTVIENGECDFAITLETNERFRVSAYKQMGNYAIAIRVIKSEIPTFESLHLPEIIKKFTKINRGLVLITGPTGSGKTTTLASIIDIINSNYQKHIITLEDPIEYIHHHKKSIVNQREIGKDSKSFNSALKSILRQDPDVILIGEMRDEESIASAISASETGHLVFSTVHTIGAAKTIDRIVDMFPANKQNQIRMQLWMEI
jgi:twitching motility protein PilT